MSSAAALLLCGWLLTYATHIHGLLDEQAPTDSVHYCGICASLSTGAPPPVLQLTHFDAWPPAPAVAPSIPVPSIAPLPAYRSRAPPVG